MPDIFISYSRTDSEQALSLAERLRAEGMSVWIDQQGIEAAKTWSEEIVNAIEGSKAFVILLSSHSIESSNVAKELSLASESERKLVPVMIEDVSLPAKFKYHLAGIQRVAYTQHDAITQALISCGITITKSTANKQDERKALLVMPFEDLSPTQDNLWFADGLAGELIDTLAHMRSLRLIDRKTARELRSSSLGLSDIASTLKVDYVVEGSVRKFGDQIKVSVALMDIRAGEYLWQESQRGTMEDIFSLQEHVAERVVAALRLHLDSAERKTITSHHTSNSEAYSLYLKAVAEYNALTREGMANAVTLAEAAFRLDPQFAQAYGVFAVAHLSLHRTHEPSNDHLAAASAASVSIREIEGTSFLWHRVECSYALRTNRLQVAREHAEKMIALQPRDALGYGLLAFVQQSEGDLRGAIETQRRRLELEQRAENYDELLNILAEVGDMEQLKQIGELALPYFEQRLKIDPDNSRMACGYASTLFWTGRPEAAHEEAMRLLERNPQGYAGFNLACLFCDLGDHANALASLRRTIDSGFSDLEALTQDNGLSVLKDDPAYIACVELVRDRRRASSSIS